MARPEHEQRLNDHCKNVLNNIYRFGVQFPGETYTLTEEDVYALSRWMPAFLRDAEMGRYCMELATKEAMFSFSPLQAVQSFEMEPPKFGTNTPPSPDISYPER